jgi:hypothetical protein
MDQNEPQGTPAEPEIYMPTEAATATAPDGRKLVFFTVPQLDLMIRRVIAARPHEYTYRWGYHPGHKIHVLLFGWPSGEGAGLAIPEGAGDMVLHYMLGTTDVLITTHPVQEALQGNVSAQDIEKILLGNTVRLPDVKFKPEQ